MPDSSTRTCGRVERLSPRGSVEARHISGIDADFRKAMTERLLKQIYCQIREEGEAA
jgi:hypothetical protein